MFESGDGGSGEGLSTCCRGVDGMGEVFFFRVGICASNNRGFVEKYKSSLFSV